MLDGGEVGGGMSGADAAFVIAEDHVHDPVETVFHRPMAAHDGSERIGEQHQGCDVEPGFALDLASCLAFAFDHDDGFEAGPVMALLEPGDIMDDGGLAGFDAAMIAVNCLILADFRMLEALSLLLGGEQFDILAKAALVAFQRQNVIGFLGRDGLCDLAASNPWRQS